SRARQRGGEDSGYGGGPEVTGRDKEARPPTHDHLADPAPPERHDRSSACLRLGGDHPEWLIPAHGAEHDGCASHHPPERGPRNARMHGYVWLGAVRRDPSSRVFVVVAVTKELDPDVRGAGDLDRLG